MIKTYNRTQILKAVLYFVGGLFCSWLSYLFFRYITSFICGQFDLKVSSLIPVLVGWGGLIATFFSGFRVRQKKGGFFSYGESGLYHDLSEDSGSAVAADFYAHRVTGPAYMLGQIFMAGPLWLLESLTRIKSRIPFSRSLEERLAQILRTLKEANKWQGLEDYPSFEAEIRHLAQMKLIDFSDHKGRTRFKAS